jgi:enoyl-CoA hydratase
MTTADASVDELLVDLTDGVLSVTINRPDSLNSLNAAVLTGIAETFEAAAGDPAVKVARLGGAGRGFSSGAGIGADDPGSASEGDPVEVLHLATRAVRAIVALPQPVVSVVHGPAAGVGVSLALAGDLVLAGDTAFFMLAFTKIGLMPDGGASALVAASVGRARAMRMALLAERISAADALAWGLVSNVYPAADLEAEVATVLDRLRHGPAVSQALTKNAINAATLTEFEPALSRETEGQIKLLHGTDFREGIKAFQERRTPTFTDT